jgi:hypothetical protein
MRTMLSRTSESKVVACWGLHPQTPAVEKLTTGQGNGSARWGARRWARLRKYRAALLRGLPARVCFGYAPHARSLPLWVTSISSLDCKVSHVHGVILFYHTVPKYSLSKPMAD